MARHWLAAETSALLVQAVARIWWLRWVPRWFVAPWEGVLIRLRGRDLFDAMFYMTHHPDIGEAGADAFRHYLRHGWREGRAVNAHFDDGHYRAESGLVRGAPVSALAHFLAFGRRQGLCPVPGIDLDAHGAAEPDIAVARMNPYDHLLGAIHTPGPERLDPADIMFRCGRLTRPEGEAQVAVVMPVYLGRLETLNAICHVLEAECQTAFVLVVVNDATPDTKLAEDLRKLASRGAIHLLDCPVNQGFVAAINLGCAALSDLDTIWLNSDTEVYDGWIDRLRVGAYRQPNVATVTPLSNNGTICSYPRTNCDNPGVLELPWRAVDAMASRINAGILVESPTAVGFATYVRRDALEAIGPLDEAAFGRGYGEENDFSQRAVQAGWVNLVAADVLVRHLGAVSFQRSRAERIEAALKVLDRRYPGYHAAVADFLARDPLAPARAALDKARLQRLKGRRNVLLITHSSGGGTQQHVQEETARLSAAGCSVFLMTGGAGGPQTARLLHSSTAALPGLSRLSLSGDALWRELHALDLADVQVHHLLDFGEDGPELVRRGLARLRVPYAFVVHDYLAICPRVNLADRKGMYCREPGLAGCRRCIERRGSRTGRPDISAWRAMYRQLLEGAREVRAPDIDAEMRLQGYFPSLDNLLVLPHEAPEELRPRRVPPRRSGPLRIAVIGAIGPTKGFDVLLELAEHGRKAGQDVAFTVIGYTRNDVAAAHVGIEVTGAYLNSEVDALIDRIDPDLIWIPSTWPETYSYTLSIALRSGRPVAAFDIGALGTRLRGVDRATRIPLEMSQDPAALWHRLCEAARPIEADLSDALS
ncbi:MAG: glycosyltransferase [Paracoccaceae bacterium]